MTRPPPSSPLFPHPPLSRSQPAVEGATKPAVFQAAEREIGAAMRAMPLDQAVTALLVTKQHQILAEQGRRSEEHTSELQSPDHLVCRLLLEKKKKNHTTIDN